ncbi:MAG: hypothetical protein AAF657_31825 [Acidobacteriota bacterium]
MTNNTPKTICLVTCRKLAGLTADDQVLADAFARADWTVDAVSWDDPTADWVAYDAVILRSTWDYHQRVEEFRQWLQACQAAGVPLWNPPDLVQWNIHKGYLEELAQAGLPVVPTVIVRPEAPRRLAEILEERGWSQAVLKPAVSATAYRTVRTSPDTAADDQAQLEAILGETDALIQPFVPEIASAGEISLLFFGGRYSHAVLKRAKPGDFRVQSDFGGSETLLEPSAESLEQAQRIADAIRRPWLYARIDVVDQAGTLVVMEIELIEPQLFFAQDHRSATALINALEERLAEV